MGLDKSITWKDWFDFVCVILAFMFMFMSPLILIAESTGILDFLIKVIFLICGYYGGYIIFKVIMK